MRGRRLGLCVFGAPGPVCMVWPRKTALPQQCLCGGGAELRRHHRKNTRCGGPTQEPYAVRAQQQPAARTCAVTKPSPWLAPVTIATLPSRRRDMTLYGAECGGLGGLRVGGCGASEQVRRAGRSRASGTAEPGCVVTKGRSRAPAAV